VKILIINGPNLNLLGSREAEHYGTHSLEDIQKLTDQRLSSISSEIKTSWIQSNIEGEIVTFIQDAANQYDGIVINPGGYSHTSVSILDALKIFKGTKVEVHLSKLTSRKDLYRQKMITAEGVDILLEGLLDLSYFIGVFSIYSRLKPKG